MLHRLYPHWAWNKSLNHLFPLQSQSVSFKQWTLITDQASNLQALLVASRGCAAPMVPNWSRGEDSLTLCRWWWIIPNSRMKTSFFSWMDKLSVPVMIYDPHIILNKLSKMSSFTTSILDPTSLPCLPTQHLNVDGRCRHFVNIGGTFIENHWSSRQWVWAWL